MGTLSNIVITVLFAALVGAGFYSVYRQKIAQALAVFGVVSLALYVTLERVAYADFTKYLMDVAYPGVSGKEPYEPTWGHLSSDFFDAFAWMGFVLILSGAIVFGGQKLSDRLGQRIEEAELSSQKAQREHELQEHGWPVGQKAGPDFPDYASADETSKTPMGQNDSGAPGTVPWSTDRR